MYRVILVVSIMFFFSCSSTKELFDYSSIERLERDLNVIAKTEKSRNYKNIATLNFVADYIYTEFEKNCDTVYFQKYFVDGVEYKNVVASVGVNNKERIIVGAHYDVYGDQEGADDNASGVSGLLELSRLLSKDTLEYRIDFVAYTLEEPPFFRSENMGSYIHAKSLYHERDNIKGMICLEMIGYFNDNENSQDYPVDFLKWFYGDEGDYITVVQKYGNGSFGRKMKRKMKAQGLIKTKSFKSSSKLSGVDFSDHLNYWKFGYDAVMITNTSFYRNKNYHKKTDVVETLDLKRMSLVIDQVYLSIKEF